MHNGLHPQMQLTLDLRYVFAVLPRVSGSHDHLKLIKLCEHWVVTMIVVALQCGFKALSDTSVWSGAATLVLLLCLWLPLLLCSVRFISVRPGD